MINAIIIDDEQHNIENIKNIIDKYRSDITIVAVAEDADEGISAIKAYTPDLVFLDIQMPGKSGFELLSSLPGLNFEVIFITAHDKYGIQAIKFSALDYLLKPINIKEFNEAIDKAKQKINTKKQNHHIENLLEYLKAGNKESPKIALPTLKEIMYVRIADIIRCEATNNYTSFFLQNGEQVLVCKTLKDFAELLRPHQFVRTHQSHLVNIQFVKSYLKEDGGTLLLNDLQKVPISRQNRELTKNALKAALTI
ncbi:response regulator transcription factor [Pedobacter sp. N36a]|uniref:LytR/AlgR family response regulator transcription factor n=1 Tax=Pedobacter sp. N36a TaxID=2767996 RepID=UPI0016570005|nr:LytTR family DNA-binding domain-containing protein [Pedobacter sp. N36a]MBC8985051.1 response regulator transcription factor [Pedobacter sp. N36a]